MGPVRPILKAQQTLKEAVFWRWPIDQQPDEQCRRPHYWTGDPTVNQWVDVTAELKDDIQRLADRITQKKLVGKEVKDTVYGKKEGQKPYDDFRVHTVLRVQNPRLWSRYSKMRSKMLQAGTTHSWEAMRECGMLQDWMRQPGGLQKDANELYLFHGTGSRTTDLIAINGFAGETYASLNGLFGKGNYFAEKMHKSDQYVDPDNFDGLFNMILGRVAMGRSHGTPEDPVKNLNWMKYHGTVKAPEGYNSIIGRGFTANPGEGNEFVVYRNAQTYPEYLIRFERVLVDPPPCNLGDAWTLEHKSKESLATNKILRPDRTPAQLASRSKDTVRVVFVSDTRGRHWHLGGVSHDLPSGDVFVHGGNFVDNDRSASKNNLLDSLGQLEDFVDWIKEVVAPRFKHVILVPGRHDAFLDPETAAMAFKPGEIRRIQRARRSLTTLPSHCTVLDGHHTRLLILPVQEGGACLRIAASSVSPLETMQAFSWERKQPAVGDKVTVQRKDNRGFAALVHTRTGLRKRPTGEGDNSQQTGQTVSNGDRVVIQEISDFRDQEFGQFARVRGKPNKEGWIRVAHLRHGAERLDRREHFRDVIAPREVQGRVDILITHAPPPVLAPDCGGGCEDLGQVLSRLEPKLHPRFHLFNGEPQGHRIFGKCAVSFSKKDWLSSFSERSTGTRNLSTTSVSSEGSDESWQAINRPEVRGRQGTVFINGSQFRSLPEDIRYHTELCDEMGSIASSACPNPHCIMAHDVSKIRSTVKCKEVDQSPSPSRARKATKPQPTPNPPLDEKTQILRADIHSPNATLTLIPTHSHPDFDASKVLEGDVRVAEFFSLVSASVSGNENDMMLVKGYVPSSALCFPEGEEYDIALTVNNLDPLQLKEDDKRPLEVKHDCYFATWHKYRRKTPVRQKAPLKLLRGQAVTLLQAHTFAYLRPENNFIQSTRLMIVCQTVEATAPTAASASASAISASAISASASALASASASATSASASVSASASASASALTTPGDGPVAICFQPWENDVLRLVQGEVNHNRMLMRVMVRRLRSVRLRRWPMNNESEKIWVRGEHSRVHHDDRLIVYTNSLVCSTDGVMFTQVRRLYPGDDVKSKSQIASRAKGFIRASFIRWENSSDCNAGSPVVFDVSAVRDAPTLAPNIHTESVKIADPLWT